MAPSIKQLFGPRENPLVTADNKRAAEVSELLREQAQLLRRFQIRARPESEWREDFGPVLWWTNPISEPPYVGTPLDQDWPGYHTHWTTIQAPSEFADA